MVSSTVLLYQLVDSLQKYFVKAKYTPVPNYKYLGSLREGSSPEEGVPKPEVSARHKALPSLCAETGSSQLLWLGGILPLEAVAVCQVNLFSGSR